ncbi:MAG: MobB mobilization protein, partial [Synergistaceae bacterium]|nr:MobB mobilization protein [Synergistaceae bacterium]
MIKENLEARIDFRVTRDERLEIQEGAEASGLSVSEYVRRRALGRRVDSVTDVKMISELRRQGGLLKKIYSESD